MKAYQVALLYARTAGELLRYELRAALLGFRAVHADMRATTPDSGRGGSALEEAACRCLAAISAFYWKPIRCLQRSVVLSRVLQSRGIPASVVVGFRPAPFLGHAWVEVNGRVLNDSAGYRAKLRVFDGL